MVRIQLNILRSKLFDSFQYIIIFMLSLVCYLLLVIKISIILIDSTTLQLCWNMYHVCLEFVQKAIPCCRCIDFANFSKNCRNDSKITTFAKYRQWSLLQMQYGMWKRCWYKIWKHKKKLFHIIIYFLILFIFYGRPITNYWFWGWNKRYNCKILLPIGNSNIYWTNNSI